MKEQIKVGFCVAYDWYLLEYSLPLIYAEADIICLSIDINRISWSGLSYTFDNQRFYALVRRIDTKGKVKFLEENFYEESLTPMQNEVRQRNRIAEFMGVGGWHVQLDCDEYFVDFPRFVKYLVQLPNKSSKNVNICCSWIVLYKKTENGFLYVNPERKDNLYFIQVATRDPSYEYGRRNGHFNVYTSFFLIHQSWARSEQEIKEKVANWGHSKDFDSQAYFDVWNAIDESTYQGIKNFHPTNPPLFPSLIFERGETIKEFMSNLKYENIVLPSSFEFFAKNSRWISRLKKAVRMIFLDTEKVG